MDNLPTLKQLQEARATIGTSYSDPAYCAADLMTLLCLNDWKQPEPEDLGTTRGFDQMEGYLLEALLVKRGMPQEFAEKIADSQRWKAMPTGLDA